MYLFDDPAACVNCHIMTPYYQSWFHNSHAKWTNCNDCHVPQDNIFKKYYFNALKIVGKEMSVDEVMEEVMADVDFYENSGGGITLSGGEPL